MNLLVTGATGFIGSAFVRLAREHGHRIGALVRPETLRTRKLQDKEDLFWLPGTLSDPPWDSITDFSPEVCLHAAWIATPDVYLESPQNADWQRWSLEFIKRAHLEAGVRRFVVLGTCIEYQISPDHREPLAEAETPIRPASYYAKCKNALRVALEEEASRYHSGFELCWGRVFYPYGPGEHPQRLCSSLVRQLSAGEVVFLKTPDSTKDYIYIDDLGAALLALVGSSITSAVNLGTGQGVTVQAIARTIARLLSKPGLVQSASERSPDPLSYVVADSTRLRSLGWQPVWSLEAGLGLLIAQSTAPEPAAYRLAV